jgi:hypothetical protein
MLHPERWRMVKHHPAEQSRRVASDEYVIRTAPTNFGLVLDECTGDGWTKGAGYTEDVAKAVAEETVLHGNQLAHHVVVGELCSGAHADESHAANEVWDACCSGTYDGAKSTADGTTDKDVAGNRQRLRYIDMGFDWSLLPTTKNIRDATDEQERNRTGKRIYQ